MGEPEPVSDAAEQSLHEPQQSVLAARLARLIDGSQALREVAIEVGLVDGEWLAEPLRRRPTIVSPLEVLRRFLERAVERHPSTLTSLGLNAIDLLSWDLLWERRMGLRPARDTVRHAAVVFTDLEGFTRYTAEAGDEAALALVAEHQRLAGAVVRRRGGRIVKSLGDGLMLVFSDDAAALHCALDLLETAPAPLRLRAGVHAGDVVITSDDLVGHVVNVAARVAASAHGGEVLATAAVLESAGPLPDLRITRPRRLSLRGVEERVPVSRLEPAPG